MCSILVISLCSPYLWLSILGLFWWICWCIRFLELLIFASIRIFSRIVFRRRVLNKSLLLSETPFGEICWFETHVRGRRGKINDHKINGAVINFTPTTPLQREMTNIPILSKTYLICCFSQLYLSVEPAEIFRGIGSTRGWLRIGVASYGAWRQRNF